MSNTVKRPRKLTWRDYLTQQERATLAAADGAKEVWEELNMSRPRIVNRAIQRAKNAAKARK